MSEFRNLVKGDYVTYVGENDSPYFINGEKYEVVRDTEFDGGEYSVGILDEDNSISSYHTITEDYFYTWFVIRNKEKEQTVDKVTSGQIDMLLDEAEFKVFHRVFDKQCIVVAQLRNGFTIVGESACVDPNNYDEEIGYNLAYKRIEQKLWELEGYALQKVIAGEL